MTELLAGLLGVLVGALIGNRLAIGRDQRKERNAARLPIHIWFQNNEPGSGQLLFRIRSLHEDDLKKYRAVAKKTEWKSFCDHMSAIDEVRQMNLLTVNDQGYQVPSRQPTENELALVAHHWNAIIRITRQR